jgi:glycine oxidase
MSEGAERRDVLIVGAGLIGLGIAYELAKEGVSVRILDGQAPASSASWAGAGMLAPYTEALEGEAFEAACAQSLQAFPAFAAELEDRTGVDVQLRLDGIVEAAYDETSAGRLQAHVATLAERGIRAEWHDRRGALALEGILGRGCIGAALVRDEGQVDNRALGRALRIACEALGVRIDVGLEALALEVADGRARGVQTKRGFLAAATVINAAGAWAGSLAGVPLEARIPVVPIKGQMFALAVPPRLIRRVLWVPGAYLVPRADGRLLVGATVEDAGFDQRVTAGGLRTVLDAALDALPGLRDFSMCETWAGLRPGSPDGIPFIGATPLEGYLVASGHHRNGILLAPLTARLVADLILGRPSEHLALFSLQRSAEPAPAARSASASA